MPEFGETIDPHRAKVISFLNAKKLREGKIMASINHELQIFDIADLDCEVSIRTNAKDSVRSLARNTAKDEVMSETSKYSFHNYYK